MLRRATGALSPLLGANGAAKRMVKEVAVKRQMVQPRKASTKAPWQQTSRISSLLWAQRVSNIKEISTKRFGPFRAALFPVKRPFHTTRARRAAANEPTTLSGRLKKLSREYGWSAVGVYMALSVLDFPFCFILVRAVGTEKICKHGIVIFCWAMLTSPSRDRAYCCFQRLKVYP